MGPLPLSRASGRGQNWVPDPASSTGAQGRNFPFREDRVESAIRTTVSVANGCPLVPPLLDMVDNDESQPPSPETLPRIRISSRNGVEYADT